MVATLDAALYLVGREGQRGGQFSAYFVVVGESVTRRFGFGADSIELFGRVESIIGVSRFDQLQGIFQVYFFPFTLAVGGVGASFADSFVNGDTAPLSASMM